MPATGVTAPLRLGGKTLHSTTWLVVAGNLLSQQEFILRDYTIMGSVTFLPGDDNKMEDATFSRWDIPYTHLLAFFDLHLTHHHSWKLCPILSEVRQNITTALRNGRNTKGSVQVGTKPAPPPGGNGWTSAHGLLLTQTSPGYLTPSHISKFLQT